jgi:hypothetical protein
MGRLFCQIRTAPFGTIFPLLLAKHWAIVLGFLPAVTNIPIARNQGTHIEKQSAAPRRLAFRR